MIKNCFQTSCISFISEDVDEIFERNVIWKYKYLKIGGETREERKILEDYFSEIKASNINIYETGLYIKTDNTNITFDKDDKQAREFVMYEKEDLLNKANSLKSKIFSNNIYATDIKDEHQEENERKSKNQILDN